MLPASLCRRFCHWLRAGNRCPEDSDCAAEAVCPLWSDHSSDEDGVDRVQETVRPPGVGRWERHIRLSGIDPLLDAVAPGVLGDQTQNSQAAAPSHQEVAVAVGSHPPSRPPEIPGPEALPEVAGALPVLWYPRELPSVGGRPSLCGEGVALLAESSQSQESN